MARCGKTLGCWIVVLFLLLYTVVVGVVFCFNVLILYIEQDFSADLALLELLGALPASVPGLAAPGALWLNLRFGAWRTVGVGTVLTALGLALSGVAPTLTVLFVTYGGLVSVGVLLILNPPFYLIDRIFPYEHPRHVLATSICACGFPLAALVINPVANEVALMLGWHFTYVILALTLLFSGAAWVVAAALWDRQEEEEAAGRAGTGAESEESPATQQQNVAVSPALRTTICIIWTVASISKCIAYYTPMLTLVKQMDTLGIPRATSWTVMPVVGASELVSRLAASWFGDLYKRSSLSVYVVSCVALAVVSVLGSFSTSHVHFMLYGAGLGVFGGPIIASLYSCSHEVLYGQDVPFVFSLFRTGIGVACLVGPIIAGCLYDWLGTLHPIFYLYAILYLVAAFIYLVILLLNKHHRPGKPRLLSETPLSYQTLPAQ